MIEERTIPQEIISQMKSETAAVFYLELMASEEREQASNQIVMLLAA